MPSFDNAWGNGYLSEYAMALGATGTQAPSSGESFSEPTHGFCVLPFRPACASCMPGTHPWLFRKCVIRARNSMCASLQIPKSSGLMRPSGVTAVASVNTRPAPPTARLPRCTRCQSFANPSMLEYSHIGETAIRFGNVMLRIESGSNICAMFSFLRFLALFQSPQSLVTPQTSLKVIPLDAAERQAGAEIDFVRGNR